MSRKNKKNETLDCQHEEQPTSSTDPGQVAEPPVSDGPLASIAGDGPIGATNQRVSTLVQEGGRVLATQVESNLVKAVAEGVHTPDEYNITAIAVGADPGVGPVFRNCVQWSSLAGCSTFSFTAPIGWPRDSRHLTSFERLCRESGVALHVIVG